MEAYLFGLRVPSLEISWDFRPPFTLVFFGWSPWLKVERFASEGRVRIEAVEGWGTRKVLIESEADPVSSQQVHFLSSFRCFSSMAADLERY